MISDFRLHVFLRVAERMNFTKAAQELFLTQPSVSNNIAELETQLGTALFVRNGTHLALSPAGKRLIPYARQILRQYDRLYDEFGNNDQQGGERKLTIGASSTISQYILPPILADYIAQYPKLSLSVIHGNSETMVQHVREGRIAMALIEDDARPKELHFEDFLNDEIIPIVAPQHPLAHKSRIQLEEFCQQDFVFREQGSGTLDVIDRALRQKNIKRQQLHTLIQLGSTEAIKRFVSKTQAIALVSKAAVEHEIKSGQLCSLSITQFKITRKLRFVNLQGEQDRWIESFKQFCKANVLNALADKPSL